MPWCSDAYKTNWILGIFNIKIAKIMEKCMIFQKSVFYLFLQNNMQNIDFLHITHFPTLSANLTSEIPKNQLVL